MAEYSVAVIELGRIVSSKILSEINLESNVRRDIESLVDWLHQTQALLNDHEKIEGSQFLQNKLHQIQTLACQIEDAIDEFAFLMPKDAHGRKTTKPNKKAIRDLRSRINAIKEQVKNMREIDSLLLPHRNTNPAEDPYSVGRIEKHGVHHFQMEEDVMGFECETEDIISQLLSAEPGRSLISLVGPAGSGKTTLAYHVYESERVQGHFNHQAWVSASRPLNLKKVLRDILVQFRKGMNQNLTDTDALSEALDNFRETSYLVVLDDIWRKEECDCIINALPASRKQYSRIIVTSRFSDVASSYLHKHELKGLSREKALTLFCKKAFQTSNCRCPPELEELTEKIAEKCEGLPLHLVDAGVLLSSKRQIPSEWKYVYDRLGAELPNIRSKILPSYKDLPSDLKMCLLYFSIFPENHPIQRERLKRLWIAEGFVNEQGNRTREDVAEDYLNELIRRNLIYVCARHIDGRVKSCRLPNLIHQFIVCKAEEENLIKILTKASSRKCLDNVRRLSIKSDAELSNLNLEHIRSAFFFARPSSSFPSNFRLLMVLEMEGAPLESFPIVILKLILLSYLSLRQTKIRSVPDSIMQLQHLETLDLRQTHLSCLPKEIFKLHYLRHLLVSCSDVKGNVRSDGPQGVEIFSRLTGIFDSTIPKIDYVMDPVDGIIKGLFDWPNIQSLSLVKANYMLLTKLGDFTNLRKLGLTVLKRRDGRKICEAIQKMEHLSTLNIMTENEGEYLELDHVPDQPGFRNLERLYLRGCLRELPRWIHQLPSLIKIRLKWSRLDTSPLLLLQNLPCLMQLELVDAYRGNSLKFMAGTFPKLKVLHIEQLHQLNMLVVEEEALPKLEKLKISQCGDLKSLPSGIYNLKHLEELLWNDKPVSMHQ